jgi:hypothetical protein
MPTVATTPEDNEICRPPAGHWPGNHYVMPTKWGNGNLSIRNKPEVKSNKIAARCG